MLKILVVEDDPLHRDVLTRRLRWEGYEVVTTADGAQAVFLAHGQQPDLILMDVGLPGMDGWDATQIIKRDASTRHIPIIIVTAYALPAERRIARQAGCDAFVAKPIVFAELFSAIQDCLANAAKDGRRPRADDNDASARIGIRL
ncbi:MAG TPA: response regulator [Kouleothrix sp.]|uniref:response regulator n=1 Tax=Kouleothrix sp. TaxID=2779161 RepID=UPI002BF4757D|nr:response regulator [Kouleothrix sp.]